MANEQSKWHPRFPCQRAPEDGYSRKAGIRATGGLHLDNLLHVFLGVERQRTVILLDSYSARQLCAGCGGEILLRLLDMLQGTSNLKGRDSVTR